MYILTNSRKSPTQLALVSSIYGLSSLKSFFSFFFKLTLKPHSEWIRNTLKFLRASKLANAAFQLPPWRHNNPISIIFQSWIVSPSWLHFIHVATPPSSARSFTSNFLPSFFSLPSRSFFTREIKEPSKRDWKSFSAISCASQNLPSSPEKAVAFFYLSLIDKLFKWKILLRIIVSEENTSSFFLVGEI